MAGLISKPLFYLSFLLFFAYAYLFRMKDANLELLRNFAFLIFFSLLFAKALSELLFLYALPALFVLMAALERKRLGKFEMGRKEIAGALLVFASVIVFSLFYRERVPDFAGAVLMGAFSLLACSGTYLMFKKSSLAPFLAVFVFGGALFSVGNSSPLYVLEPALWFVPNIPFGLETTHSYLVKTANLAISALFVLAGSLGMLHRMHSLCRGQGQV